jgi:hypothetical protein
MKCRTCRTFARFFQIKALTLKNQLQQVMKRFFYVMAFALIASVAGAQVNPTADEEKLMKTLAEADSGWTVQGTLNLGANLSLFNNWAAGGMNSLGLNGLFNGVANYRKGVQAWDNQLILGYGMLNQGFATGDAWVKTDDRIDFTSKYGRKMSENLYYAALLNFQTQFTRGFATRDDGRMDRTQKISNFLAPGKLLLAIGVDYKPRPELSIFFSPATYRGIFVYDQDLADAGAFGVEKAYIDEATGELVHGENMRHEFGAYLRVNYEKKFSERFSYSSILELFSNYLDTPQNIDINWQNIAAWKFNKNFSVTFMWQALYDDNTAILKTREVTQPVDASNPNGPTMKVREQYASKGLQLRSVLSVGFVQNF